MKKFIFTALMFLAVCSFANAQKYFDKLKVKTSEDSVSYSIGFMLAQNIVKQGIEDLSPDMLGKAFKDVFTNSKSAIPEDDAQMLVLAYFMKIQSEVEQKAKEKEKEFLDNNIKEPGVQVTESGLQYLVVREGTGAQPRADQSVKVHYEGKLIDGTVFESSYDNDEPTSFPLDAVIPGMAEGIMLMKEGAEYIFYIPSDLGYGDYSVSEDVPAYSTLIFNVELFSVFDTPAEEAVTDSIELD